MPIGNAIAPVNEGFGQTLLHFLRDPTYYAFFKAADFWLGVTGFGITLVGFWIAAQRLKDVETAANAAKDAVKDFKVRINRYDAANDVSSAKSTLMILSSTIEASDWRTVRGAITDVRHAISRASTVLTNMDADLGREMIGASVQLDKIISGIDRSLMPSSRQPDKVGVQKICRATVDVFVRAQHVLQEKIP